MRGALIDEEGTALAELWRSMTCSCHAGIAV